MDRYPPLPNGHIPGHLRTSEANLVPLHSTLYRLHHQTPFLDRCELAPVANPVSMSE